MMKRSLILGVALSFLISFLNAGEIFWESDYQKALQNARNKQKPMLLFFTGSDWCGWSMKLKKEILDTPEFEKEVADQFIFVEIDFPLYKSISSEILEQNNVLKDQNQINNFPTIVLLDPKQRAISKINYIPIDGKNYAEYLLKQIEQDNELTEFMIQVDHHVTSEQLEKFYKRAFQFQREKEALKLLEVGLKSEDNLYFLAEKYRLLVDRGEANSKDAISLRRELLEIDPDNNKNMQFFIALTDFQMLSSQTTPGIDPKQIVAPLKNYLERFKEKDKENVWRLEMMMAQFFYDYEDNDQALLHAQIAYEEAPLSIKPEIKRSIDYIKQHPAS